MDTLLPASEMMEGENLYCLTITLMVKGTSPAVEITIVSPSSRLERSAMERSLNTAILQLEKISRLRSK